MKKKVKYTKEQRALFRETGRMGGKKRAENMTPEQRSEVSRKAAQARWNKDVVE